MADLITLDDYKSFQGISSTKDDDKLELLVPSVSQLVKTYCANTIIDFYTSAKIEYFTLDYATHLIQLTESPIVLVSSVEIKESFTGSYTTLTSTDYFVDDKTDSLIRVAGNTYKDWPEGPNSVKVTYTAGYSETPLDLKLAVVDLITYYARDEYKIRQTLSGATRENPESSTRNSPAFPDHIKRVLDLYKLNP